MKQCKKCKGTGKSTDEWYLSQLDQRDYQFAEKSKCKSCNGTGGLAKFNRVGGEDENILNQSR